jgi:molybdenum cofactor synthesis domain-containing protein
MNPAAAILVIGDEILSGRTQDTNSTYIARQLAGLGIDLKEIRVVPDLQDEIVTAVNALRARYDLLFTTGGIGPTHDDITADAMAKAFGVGIGYHPEAYALLEARYGAENFNEARKRMARVPDGGTLVKNPVSTAPGFRVGNVFVMAGVPAVMRAMMEEIIPALPRGVPVTSITLSVRAPEGAIAAGLEAVQKDFADTAIGSYPFHDADGIGTQLVTRSRDAARAELATQAIEAMLACLGATFVRVY